MEEWVSLPLPCMFFSSNQILFIYEVHLKTTKVDKNAIQHNYSGVKGQVPQLQLHKYIIISDLEGLADSNHQIKADNYW